MNRLLLLVFFFPLLLVCVVAAVSCGNVFVRGAINPASQSANGTVSIVQFSSGSGGVSITIVTLTGNGAANTLNFCGDQRPIFPANQQVEVSFMPGTPCDNLLSVQLMGMAWLPSSSPDPSEIRT